MNELVKQIDKYQRILLGDTDSVVGETMVFCNENSITIENLYNTSATINNLIAQRDSGDFVHDISYLNLRTKSVIDNDVVEDQILKIMKHRVKKRMFKITVDDNSVIVTEDHSIMVKRLGVLISVKPTDIKPGDAVISINTSDAGQYEEFFNWINEDLGIQELDVYDIETKNTNMFFGNNILVHNSIYININEYAVKKKLKKKELIAFADDLGEKLNATFPKFMDDNFLIGEERGKLINAKREAVASRGLFKQAKKRYALHVIDIEGKSKDNLKIVGLETNRSDTPKFIQDWLEIILEEVVRNKKDFEYILEMVEYFREEFHKMPPWKQGAPGGIKNLAIRTKEYARYLELETTGYKANKPHLTMPVKAAMNTNQLIEFYEEKNLDLIHDGDKVEMIYLKEPNEFGMGVVAIPSSSVYVPDWFKALPFDSKAMEEKLIFKKLHNILEEVFGWNFTPPESCVAEVTKEDDSWN